ncbi:hypothetical protein IB642_02895 [Allofrancisella guangzhouensis]|uniref:Uncharacterized protein n=1 Tax=Allofrancisella guangzhouensis TaxID=594679 RepID=A0A0A8E390_9GAMM|nr:hypothetical protein [Allofrancisella guangzhouensis]AJC48685.1 hypothetical protein SD28_03000 [Allofrancisella guangzhouensis]MBK2027913.1 hypothetical protein [Allofrancisella guangzhouensis]MBK2043964.1 hypothetical protein [Allofrancisella guangzhouensis]MBK2046375.1 hypothetical protein [Allofrancisella guangzhouensis]
MKKTILCVATILMTSSSLCYSFDIYDGVTWRKGSVIGLKGDQTLVNWQENWKDGGGPQTLVGNGMIVEYYNGFKYGTLSPHDHWRANIKQISTNWQEIPSPVHDWQASVETVVGLDSGAVGYYDGSKWIELHDDSWVNPVNQMSVNWQDEGRPQIVVGLGDGHIIGSDAGAVEYYNGSYWTELHDNSWKSPVIQMSVNSQGEGRPQVVVGLDSGAVEYYNGSYWTELHDAGWKSSVLQMSVNWQGVNKIDIDFSKHQKVIDISKLQPVPVEVVNPQIVVGLKNSAVEYYNGSKWIELHNNSWVNPVNQMSVNWQGDGNPQVVVGLGNGHIISSDAGAVEYYNGSKWNELHDNNWKSPVNQMSVNWFGDGNPQVVVGLDSGAVEYYYTGSEWTELRQGKISTIHFEVNSDMRPVNYMSVEWRGNGLIRGIVVSS